MYKTSMLMASELDITYDPIEILNPILCEIELA
jgi:hypothetical protein